MPQHFIETLDDPLLFERIPSFGGGVDAYNTASELGPTQSRYFENVIVRDNLRPRTRPGADILDSQPSGGANAIQGAIYFDTPVYEQLIAASNGNLYKWEGANWTAMAGWTLTDAQRSMAAVVGIKKVLISDGSQNLRSWDGAAFADLGSQAGGVQSDPPVGATILIWHTGRAFASGIGTEPDALYASALLDFGSSKWDHVNFKIRVGGGEGDPIMGGASMQGFNLVILKESSVYLVNTDPTQPTAANWAIAPLSTELGCVGKRAYCRYGNEVLFFSQDGVRSVQRMQSAAGQYEIAPPISVPVQPYIDRINWNVASGIVARNYKELVLFAVPMDGSLTNNALLVYNARLGVWLGLWTGWAPTCFEITRFNGIKRLVFGETTGIVRQWKDFQDAAADATYTELIAGGVTKDIASKLWTRAMLFQEPENDKDGYYAEVRFNPSNAIVTITAVGDDDDLRVWTEDVRPEGVDLPVDLDFDLAQTTTTPTRRGLRGMKPFNELYLKIESAKGWWELRNVTLGAFLNQLKNQ